jgi:hypothetical protein
MKALYLTLFLSTTGLSQEFVEPIDDGEVIVIRSTPIDKHSARAGGGAIAIANAISQTSGKIGGGSSGASSTSVARATTKQQKQNANAVSKNKKNNKVAISEAAKGLGRTIREAYESFKKDFGLVSYDYSKEIYRPDGSREVVTCDFLMIGKPALVGESPCTLKTVTRNFNYISNEFEVTVQIIPIDNVCSFYDPQRQTIQFSCEPEDMVAFYTSDLQEVIYLLEE